MEKKYVIKNFASNVYYGGDVFGWTSNKNLAKYFDSVDDAEAFIDSENGRFQIELVYVV